jgi:hypothetical protein
MLLFQEEDSMVYRIIATKLRGRIIVDILKEV